TPRGFAPRTPPHALSRAASSARSVRVARFASLARIFLRAVYVASAALARVFFLTPCLAVAPVHPSVRRRVASDEARGHGGVNTHCAWGPTPTRSRSAASRLARAAGAGVAPVRARSHIRGAGCASSRVARYPSDSDLRRRASQPESAI